MSNDEKLMMEVMGFSSFTGKKANRKEESEVEKKEERLTAGCPRGRDRKRATEVWEAPMSGTWQPTRGSGLPSWDKSKLKKEENPPNWVEPPDPKVDPWRDHGKAWGSINFTGFFQSNSLRSNSIKYS